MNTTLMESNPFSGGFDWERQPKSEQLVLELTNRFLSANESAQKLAHRMLSQTGTRFVDWVDHIRVAERMEMDEGNIVQQLNDVGYQQQQVGDEGTWFVNEAGLFPRILVAAEERIRVAIKIDAVADFVFAHRLQGIQIEGRVGESFRKCAIDVDEHSEFWVCERHGWEGWSLPGNSQTQILDAAETLESFILRERSHAQDEAGFAVAEELISVAIEKIGLDWACDLFFEAERRYWQSRNQAAREQFARQQSLGLGWGNHDHHTYRSSRQHFADMIRVFEKLGFHCRERFYAGADAGWGAQVLEQPQTGIIIFADVDLSPEELAGDFAHDGLTSQGHLGTVGLWCQLHGEAILQAGMHHLECQFDFSLAREQLSAAGCPSMAPFTDFEFLKQSFTVGERWEVIGSRVEYGVQQGWIQPEEAERFINEGAVGSHLEILERNEGFKGFNQTGVSDIILKTDPRKLN